MTMKKPIITAIVGSYRRGGVIDRAVDEILAAARAEGADTEKILLIDRHVEFCANCRECTQRRRAGRGVCALADEMGAILDRIDASDALVLASPMNFWTVTAIMKRFMERLVCYAYWPWGGLSPRMRNRLKEKRAVVVASSAAPAIMARMVTGMVKLLKQTADTLGARTVGVLFIGMAARQPHQELGEKIVKKARTLGKKLASP